MNIVVSQILPHIYQAIDEDTYDGAPDSKTRHQVGIGKTEDEAIADLMAEIEQEIP